MDSTRDFFWVGLETSAQPGGATLRGPMFVEHLRPTETPREAPVVLVHGGGSQGTDWLGTPDGRPGWASLLVDDGFEVYVVDRPGHGRSALHPDVLGPMTAPFPLELAQFLFAPQAGTQWPGSGQLDDPVLLALAAAFGPSLANPQEAQALERERAAQLLDRIGPAILMTHSAGAPFGWLAADSRPQLVKAIVALEPLGPPYFQNPPMGIDLAWGVTSARLTMTPPAEAASEITTESHDAGEGAPPMILQAEPARTLTNLSAVPIALISGEASPFAAFDGHTDAFLKQAGCDVELIRLGDRGVHGNGHGLIFEQNHRQVLDVVLDWLATTAQARSGDGDSA